MYKTIFIIVAIAMLSGAAYYQYTKPIVPDEQNEVLKPPPPPENIDQIRVVAQNLEIPWDFAFLPNDDLLVTERIGRLQLIKPTGVKTEIPILGVKTGGEGGLLGITLHPDFSENKFIYLYLSSAGTQGKTINRVERHMFDGVKLSEKTTIIDGIPGATYHDGGRIEFGPDKMLYITTGDAGESKLAQNRDSLAGKLLRLHDDGTIPEDNPFGTAVYSYGHRNSQGLAWDSVGRLWSTEHGRSGVTSGLDELNLIQKGGNFGWPDIQGKETKAGMIVPVLESGSDVTWAPASLAYHDNMLFFGGLRGEGLYKVELEGSTFVSLKKYFEKEFGRIRTVRVGPDNRIYFSTSNRDGRGNPLEGDDKIISIDPIILAN